MNRAAGGIEASAFAGAVILLLGIFYLNDAFIVYRVMAFSAIPHDDYVSYLQYVLTGGAGGHLPHSPFVERIGSVLMAVPFTLLPGLHFSGDVTIPADQVPYAQAVAFANVFYFYAGCAVAFYATLRLLNKSYGLSPFLIPVFLLQCLVARQVLSMYGVDGIGFFLVAIAALLVVTERLWLLSLYGAVMIVFNEKVTLCALGLVVGYAAVMRRGYLAAILPAAALAGYVAYRKVVGDNVYQLDSSLARNLTSFISSCLTPRGVLLNILPAAALSLSIFLTKRSELRAASAVAFGLLLAGAVKGEVLFTVGRVLYYISPMIIAVATPEFARIADRLALELRSRT